MIKVVNYLSDLIQEKIGVGLIPHTAKWLLEKKSLTVYGKEKNLEKTIAKLSSTYAERLFSIPEERCGERLKHLDGIILGGGGAYYIRDYIPRRLRNLTIVMEEPEFSNARGFYKTLMAKEGEKHED
jgi:plasmid segregation protein ParM